MKKLLITSLLLSCINLFSQSDKILERSKKQYQAIVAKPLCVVLDIESEKFINKLSKKNKEQELKNYKKLIADYNSFIKSAVTEYIKEFPSVKFITTDEYKKLDKKELKANAFLVRTFPAQSGSMVNSGFSTKPSFGGMGGGSTFGISSVDGTPENIELDTTNVKDASIIQLLSWQEDELLPVYSQNLNKLFCTKAEVYLTVRQLKTAVNGAINKTTTKETATKLQTALKTKTLIINKTSLSDNLTEAAIKKVYSNSFKIVEQAEYDNLFFTKKEDIVLLVIIPAANSMGMFGINHCLFDPSNDASYVPNPQKCKEKIKKEHFEWYTKPVE